MHNADSLKNSQLFRDQKKKEKLSLRFALLQLTVTTESTHESHVLTPRKRKAARALCPHHAVTARNPRAGNGRNEAKGKAQPPV